MKSFITPSSAVPPTLKDQFGRKSSFKVSICHTSARNLLIFIFAFWQKNEKVQNKFLPWHSSFEIPL